MTNDYFDSYSALAEHTQARGSAINSLMDSIIVGFDKLPSEADVKGAKTDWATDSGTANAYVLTSDYPIDSLYAGLRRTFIVANGNTGTGGSVVNIDGQGNVALKRNDGSTLQDSDLPTGAIATIVYNGTNCRLTSVQNGDVTAAGASATAAASSASAASTSETNAASSASSASGYATTASNYATKTDDYASGSDNSAKSWAVGGTGNGQPSAGDAKSWATNVSSTVDGSGYSAKEWAKGTQTRGASGGGSAKDWATYTGGTVDDADYSAKFYAQQAAASAGSTTYSSYLASDFSLSSTTLADTGLSLTLTPGTYLCEAHIYWTPGSSGGVKLGTGGTATISSLKGSSESAFGGAVNAKLTAAGTLISAASGSDTGTISLHFVLVVSATGTFTIQAANNSGTATSSVAGGSMLKALKIA